MSDAFGIEQIRKTSLADRLAAAPAAPAAAAKPPRKPRAKKPAPLRLEPPNVPTPPRTPSGKKDPLLDLDRGFDTATGKLAKPARAGMSLGRGAAIGGGIAAAGGLAALAMHEHNKNVAKSAFGVEKAASDDDRAKHYGRMSTDLGVLAGTAGTVGAGAGVIGHAERRGHDPMGFAERPGKKPLTPAGKLRVLKPFSEAHAYQAKTLGGLAGTAAALGGAYKYKQRKTQQKARSEVGKADAATRRRQAGDAALGAGSAAVGGSTLAFGMKNSHMLNGQAKIAGTEARSAHHLIEGDKLGGWKTPEKDLAGARRERAIGARVFAVKKPAAALAGTAAAAGGATLLELGRHGKKSKSKESDVTKSAFGIAKADHKDRRRHVAGPLARVADHNARRFDRKADRKSAKGDKAGARGNRRLAAMSRKEGEQFRQMRAGQPVCKSAFGVEKGFFKDATIGTAGAAGGAALAMNASKIGPAATAVGIKGAELATKGKTAFKAARLATKV